MLPKSHSFILAIVLWGALLITFQVRASSCECDNDGDGKPDLIFGSTTYNPAKTVYAHYSPNGDTVKLASNTRIITHVVIKFADGSYSTIDGLSNDAWEYVNPYHQIYGIYVSAMDKNLGPASATNEYLRNVNSADNPDWCNCIPLPFTLLNFQAKKVDYENVQLSWITATEINTSQFGIERSSDGKVFNKIGSIAGHGNSNNIIKYSFIDSNENRKGKVFYRITQVHFNGNYEYSNVICIYNEDWDSYMATTVYPNPVSGSMLNVDLNSTESGIANVELYNLNGVLMLRFDLAVTLGHNEGQLDIGGLKSGLYLLKSEICNTVNTVLVYVTKL